MPWFKILLYVDDSFGRGCAKEAEIIGWPTNELNAHIPTTGSRAYHMNIKDLLFLRFILTLSKFYSDLELAIESR